MRQKILIIEDKASLAQMLSKTLQGEGFAVTIALNLSEGLKAIGKDPTIDLVITDLRLPDGDGLEVLKKAKESNSPPQVIVMTAYGAIDVAVRAVKEGAYDFLTKPFDTDRLINLIREALAQSSPDTCVAPFKDNGPANHEMVGVSQAWKEILSKAQKVAAMKTTVLILGESGTGKELVARYIHNQSQRCDKPFVAVNCSAIPKELVENELFGHEKGAYTGAGEFKPGRFDMADRGTIFLDEIGDMDITVQAKILRVIQEGDFIRVGGTNSVRVDVRIIAASNKDLARALQNGHFREDLYYRLNVFPLKIPPLRDRREDILPIAEHYLILFSSLAKKDVKGFSAPAIKALENYHWPGNVRELKNAVERAVILCESEFIGPELFEFGDYGERQQSSEGSLHSISANAQRQAEIEKIRDALRQTGGNKLRAAALLKVSYKTLLTKIKSYGIG